MNLPAPMKVLIADDHAPSRTILIHRLQQWGFDPLAVPDGASAWAMLQAPEPPPLGLIDWMMPGLNGLELIELARSSEPTRACYLILVTARRDLEDLVCGLQAGADDYVVKPYDHTELRARLNVGRRVVQLQQELAEQVRRLTAASAEVKQLQGILPMCTFCKKIRDDGDYWRQVESYIAAHTDAIFSHGICPECFDSQYKQKLREMRDRAASRRSDG